MKAENQALQDLITLVDWDVILQSAGNICQVDKRRKETSQQVARLAHGLVQNPRAPQVEDPAFDLMLGRHSLEILNNF